MKIDLKRKLSSRKFWTAVAAWVTSLMKATDMAGETQAQVIIIVSGIGALVAYMLAEAYTDSKHKNNEE